MLVPMHAEWWPDVRAELLSFPAAAHDDAPDALGLIGQILDRMSAPHLPKQKEPPKMLSVGGVSTCTLTDLFEANERRSRGRSRRIW
jgi:hypothetical protein